MYLLKEFFTEDIIISTKKSNLMSSLIEKQLMSLEPAKILCYLKLQKLLKDLFIDVCFTLNGSTIVVTVLLFPSKYQSQRSLVNRTDVKAIIEEVMQVYAPSLYRTIYYQYVQNPQIYAKYYFLMIKKKVQWLKVPAFSTLNKLQNLTVSSPLTGLRIDIKGKRGLRKYQRSVLIGDVSRHSNQKDKQYYYQGVLKDSKGITGVGIVIQFAQNHTNQLKSATGEISKPKPSHSDKSSKRHVDLLQRSKQGSLDPVFKRTKPQIA